MKCPYCTRAYRHQNNLRTHIRCFHKGVRIPCPICQRGFTRWFTVRCHIAREHSNVDITRSDVLPAQIRRALYSSTSYNDTNRPTISSYQDELRLSNTALTTYGDNGAPPSILPTQQWQFPIPDDNTLMLFNKLRADVGSYPISSFFSGALATEIFDRTDTAAASGTSQNQSTNSTSFQPIFGSFGAPPHIRPVPTENLISAATISPILQQPTRVWNLMQNFYSKTRVDKW